MRITFLVDNLPHPTLPLLTEHGLSMYIDQITPNSSLLTPNSILCDMGASGAYLKNAKALGIPLARTCRPHRWFGQMDCPIRAYSRLRIAPHPYFAVLFIPTKKSRRSKVESRKSAIQRFRDSTLAKRVTIHWPRPQPILRSHPLV